MDVGGVSTMQKKLFFRIHDLCEDVSKERKKECTGLKTFIVSNMNSKIFNI